MIDLGPDTRNGTSLDNAIYDRDLYVENRLGIKFVNTYFADYSDIRKSIVNQVHSGSDKYKLVYTVMIAGAELASLGYLYALNDLSYFDTTSRWWDKNSANGFSYANKLYMTGGDILPSSLLNTNCMAFNKQYFTSRRLDSPYELVHKDNWTLSELYKLTANVTSDLNKDGYLTATDDFFGMASFSSESPYSFFFGSGCTVIKRDADDIPQFEDNYDLIGNVYEMVRSIVYDCQSLYTLYEKDLLISLNAFAQGRVVFLSSSMDSLSLLSAANTTAEFGLLPQPKRDTSQKSYLNFVNYATPMVCVIKHQYSDKTKAIIGATLEELASASYNMVTDVLYDNISKRVSKNDKDFHENFKMIIRNRVFDFGYVNLTLTSSSSDIFREGLDNPGYDIYTFYNKCKKNDQRNLRNIQKFVFGVY